MSRNGRKDLSPQGRKACEEMVSRFPKKAGALLNVFRIIEREFGVIDNDGVRIAAELCDIPPSKAYGVLTFYSTFRTQHDGKNIMWVCATLPCALRGCEEVYDHLREQLELNEHGTTKDGLLTLKKAECLGACGTAPCLQLNDDYYENLTPEDTVRIVSDLRKGVARPAGYTE